MNTLENKRIIICGKGGSGKSSFASMMGKALCSKNYSVILVDGDASNPGGLLRLVTGSKDAPIPLIEFFGGREKVTCPTDDPAPLTRLFDSVPLIEQPIDLSEIPDKYYIAKENLFLFQVGKIQTSCEGCDGPMSKINRDLFIKGNYVTLIDVEAGIEHFGRGVEENVDAIIIMVDPTFESLDVAEQVINLSKLFEIEQVWAVLNKIDSEESESFMMKELKKRNVLVIGKINLDKNISKAGLEGKQIGECEALKQTELIVKKLESVFSLSWN